MSSNHTGVLGWLDWSVVAVYFLAVIGLAVWVTLRSRKRESSGDAAGYFLAGRNAGWFVIGASLFASNIGSEHLVGLAGTGARSGVAVGQFEILASLILLVLAWVFVPFYMRSGVFTMPEFLERRYSSAARWYLALISIVGYVLTKISVTILAGGIVFETLMGIGFWTGAIAVVVLTGLYTIFGGLRVVLYTDLLQMFVLIGGAVAVTVVGLDHLGGWGEMTTVAGPAMMSLWRPLHDPDFPWTGILLGAPILGVWYWCTDQFIVQRVLSARDIEQARRGTVFGGFLKVLPLFLFVVPGVVAYALVQRGLLDLDVAENADAALPTMVGALLPAGLRGLVAAGILAALMSSLSSVFNSCATLVTVDIYKRLRPAASERRMVWVGQISTAVLVVFGLAWIPVMQSFGGLYRYLQSIQAYISPPIAAVFLLGVAWRRINAAGAVASLAVGFVLGMSRLVLEIVKDSLGPGLLHDFATYNFLHVAVGLFAVCSLVLVGVSLVTPAPAPEQLRDLTFQTFDTTRGEPEPGRRTTIAWSILLALVVALVWVYFSPLVQR
jgi:SSS family solute:Na+ symporter